MIGFIDRLREGRKKYAKEKKEKRLEVEEKKMVQLGHAVTPRFVSQVDDYLDVSPNPYSVEVMKEKKRKLEEELKQKAEEKEKKKKKKASAGEESSKKAET